jgi:hypothetical protein
MEGILKAGAPIPEASRASTARVKQLADDGVGPAKIARELMARSSVYRLLEEAGS